MQVGRTAEFFSVSPSTIYRSLKSQHFMYLCAEEPVNHWRRIRPTQSKWIRISVRPPLRSPYFGFVPTLNLGIASRNLWISLPTPNKSESMRSNGQ